ncbi:MAG: accessory Sec system S-layer assembly protein, partial [Bacillota bacterium]|nr:accessory Sec system S-layer assembly protein [Bacillota bacterium]
MALFKKKNKEETIIGQNGVPNTSTQSENSGKVKTTLIFSPDWELSNQEKYVYMYKHQQLPLL